MGFNTAGILEVCLGYDWCTGVCVCKCGGNECAYKEMEGRVGNPIGWAIAESTFF